MVEEGARCPICQVVADPLGDHQVGCGGNGDRIHRYDSVRDALFSAAQTAALAPRKEVPSLIPWNQQPLHRRVPPQLDEGTTGRSRRSRYVHPPAADIEGDCCHSRSRPLCGRGEEAGCPLQSLPRCGSNLHPHGGGDPGRLG